MGGTFGGRGQKVGFGGDLGALGNLGQEYFWGLEFGRVEQGHHVFGILGEWGPVARFGQSGFAEIFLVIAPFWRDCWVFCWSGYFGGWLGISTE